MTAKEENLSSVLKQAILSQLLDLHVALPAVIETYNPAQQKADVKPLLKKRYKSASQATDLPIIPSVPVQWPSGSAGKAFLHLPLAKGDLGIVVFCDRSLDAWLAGDGKSVDVRDPRHHHLSDAVFIPGVRPFARAMANIPENNAVLQNDLMRIEMFPDGKISITGAGSELLTVLAGALGNISDAIGHAASATVLVSSGSSAGSWPLSPGSVSALNADKAALDGRISTLEALTG